MNIKCTFWEWDGKEMTEFVDNVSSPIFTNTQTGEKLSSRDLPIGAIWYASENSQKYYRPGPDGRTLFVRTPGGDWNPDTRASNCKMPNDDVHYCWVRHGIPPNITVNKSGNTCKAGAGSIAMGNYHGFLKNGELTNC